MNKNQKIAIGCGAAGCLGLIVLAIIGAGLYFFTLSRSATSGNSNRSSNFNFNANHGPAANRNSSDSPSTSSPSSSMSDDDKHKLFQAANMTGDPEVVHHVGQKIGLMKEDNSPSDEYAGFLKDHSVWELKNSDFIQSVNTPEKAKAYVDEHMND